MKTKILSLLVPLFALVAINALSQSQYGKITMEEMTMDSYPQDTTATAVILSKVGDARFVYNDLYGFQFEYTLKMKIKILKTEGLGYCEHAISYYESNRQNREIINGLTGMTYNLEGGKIVKTKLSKEFIVDEDQDDRYKVKKITMPAAKAGSVIEYKYTLASPFYRNFPDFYFQSSIPTAYVSYDVTIPEYWYYTKNSIGYEKIASDIKSENETFSVKMGNTFQQVRCNAERSFFEGKDIPAMKDEAFLWTKEDYISKITFELQSVHFPGSMVENYTTSWKDVDKELKDQSRFGGELKKKGLFKDDVSPGDITIERATEIQNMVKEKVKWNKKSYFLTQNLKDALKNGIGSSADMNFLLINALKAGNFEAFPVILSTRSNGRLPLGRPSVTAFNYVITGVTIGDKTYYTDAASEYGDWNILPQKVMVSQARAIKDDWSDWVDLTAVTSGRRVVTGLVSFAEDKSVKMVAEMRRGASGYDFRDSFHNDYKDQNEYIEKQANSLNGEIEDFVVANENKTNEDAKTSYILKQDVPLNDIIYINPMVFEHYKENPFKTEERKYPVNFTYPSNYSQIVTINIPEGYVVDELPQSEKLTFGDNNDLLFTYRITVAGNQVQLQYQFVVNSLLVLPDAYHDLQNFFSKVVHKNSEQVILKKASNS